MQNTNLSLVQTAVFSI